MGPIKTISCVETWRTLKEVFEEHHGEMPKTGFILDVKCQVCDGAHYQIMVRLEPTIYRTRGKHANHYITDAVLGDMDA